MKKIFPLLTVLMLLCISSFAQFSVTVSGYVTNTNSLAVANHTVYITSDSFQYNGNWYIMGSAQETTNANGWYTHTFNSAVPLPNGMQIITTTQNCNSTYLYNYHTYSGSSIPNSNFVICVNTPPPSANLQGTISGGGATVDSGMVYVIGSFWDTANATTVLYLVDSISTDIFGHYQKNVPAGNYLIKAAATPYSPNYASLMPTYYVNALTWNYGNTVTVPATGSVTVNITLISGSNPGGPGFIGGLVSQGANKTTGVGDPLNGRILLLTDNNNNAIGYTHSDASGHFSFSNLPYGTYKLFGDALGLQNPVLTVTLSPSKASYSNIVFEENSTSFSGSFKWTAGIGNVNSLDAVNAYPNPAKDVINVSGLDNISGVKNITLSNLTGAVVYRGSFAQGQAVAVPVSSLPGGMYLLHVATSEGTVSIKISK